MPDLLAGTTIKAQDFPATVSVEDGTDEAGFTSTTYTAGATVVGQSFTAPTSGRVLVLWGARFEHNSTGIIYVSMGVRTGATLGAGTSQVSAIDTQAITTNTDEAGGTDTRMGACFFRVVTGLTPGDTYNAVTEHRVTSGNGDIFDRSLAVIPLP